MTLMYILILFAMLWLTFGLWSLSLRVREKTVQQATIEDLRARIRTLEQIITDQDRQLGRDIDGL